VGGSHAGLIPVGRDANITYLLCTKFHYKIFYYKIYARFWKAKTKKKACGYHYDGAGIQID
jgi:hypothetical protein